ncbi:MAG TPA: amidase [Jiangellales bacterium]|nr:amidase [Jiangellales bacterium]
MPVILAELSELIRSRAMSPLEHVRQTLDALSRDPFNAVVATNAEAALAAARELTEDLAHGAWRGPLHGVAIGVKDLIDVQGLPTRCGSNVLAEAGPADVDSAVVAQLRAAGAVVVAKLHTHEFAYGPTGDVAAQGPCHNPHDPSRITGGSSSGSAAAVAAGYVPLALGTDTGCSVRVPAALCGVVGLKPAFGALPTAGVFPLSESLDHVGLITADARSAATVWDLLAPGTPADARDSAQDLAGLVVGLPTDGHWRPIDPEIATSVAATASTLESLGARLVEVTTPDVAQLVRDYSTIVSAEAHTTHAHWLATRPADYQEITADRLKHAGRVTVGEYIGARRSWKRVDAALRARLVGIDVLLVPTAPLRATPIGETHIDDVAVRPALLSMCQPFNMLGVPAVSIPGPVSDGGLPVGVQLVGANVTERRLLAIAAALGA